VQLFESIGSGAKSAKEAFADFARSVLLAIQKIAAQKLAESLFGSLGKGSGGASLGGWIAGLFGGRVLRTAAMSPVPAPPPPTRSRRACRPASTCSMPRLCAASGCRSSTR
jgi:hypothetical protein